MAADTRWGAMDEAAMGLPAGEFEVWIGDYAMPAYVARPAGAGITRSSS